jgi:phosphoglycolate phosphatase
MSESPRVVLLDLDGTLSDNYAGISASIRHALATQGVADPGEAELRTCVGPPLRETFARLIPGADRGRVEAAIASYRERFSAVGWQENEAYPGVDVALRQLRSAGLRLFVCTSKPRVFAERIVAHFGFDALVDAVYGPDLAGALDDKRHLLGHLIEAERLDPSRCTMVGDRHHDIRAARANGCGAVGVLWGYGSAEELADADRLLATPAELARLAG